MKRLALTLAALALLAPPATASAQQPPPATKAAPQAAPPPAAPAKYYRPVKGEATIEVLRGAPKRVGEDMVTVVKVKNTSPGRIDLLVVDEYWYDKDLKTVSGTTERWRKPFNPGEIIEITLKSPVKPNLYRNQLMFSHAHGSIVPKEVKKFEEPKPAAPDKK